MKLNSYLSPYRIKKNFKWIKVLTVKPEKLKHLEENIASTLHYTGKGKD